MKESIEIINAALDLIDAAREARRDDGKISRMELLGIVTTNLPGIVGAVSGIQQVPEEWQHLDAESVDIIANAVLQRIGGRMSEPVREFAGQIYRFVRDGVMLVRSYQNLPPRAEILPDEPVTED